MRKDFEKIGIALMMLVLAIGVPAFVGAALVVNFGYPRGVAGGVTVGGFLAVGWLFRKIAEDAEDRTKENIRRTGRK